MKSINGQARAVVRDMYPFIDGGAYSIKRVVDEEVKAWCDVFADGHDTVQAALQFRHESAKTWSETRAFPIGSDRWEASFKVEKQGSYAYQFIGWVDYALNWQEGIIKKIAHGIQVKSELLEGISYLETLKEAAPRKEHSFIEECVTCFGEDAHYERATLLAGSSRLKRLFEKYPNRPFVTKSAQQGAVYVDREKAAFSTWYEFFPRSSSSKPGVHGTFKDCIKLLPRVAELGFDTLYFPPVHPIGEVNRKGKNNTTEAKDGDVGSCWGIGSKDGGHMDVHPELGTLEDFKKLVKTAKKLNIEVAMDFALQAAPDHPWVKEHPSWFKHRPDGTIQYAENPPKKYQDIYPIYFESEDWKEMWKSFLEILLFWIEQGIHVFRVDNPHTKPFQFWEWIIAEVKKKHPDVLFLAEAFSRPSVMQELAKLGFTQSYTYYTWRNSKAEIIEYMNELTQGPTSETFRPNFWPNTPDILPFALQNPSESTYITRYFMAATLSGNCGVYGPVYELMQHHALSGKEEYLDSEKFEFSHWDWSVRNAVTDCFQRVNLARRKYKALQRTNNLSFVDVSNENLLAYLKTGSDGSQVLCVVNLDPVNQQAGQLHFHPSLVGKRFDDSLKLTDLMTDAEYEWRGDSHFVQLSPDAPCHLFVIT